MVSAELELLLGCARVTLDTGRAQGLRALCEQPLDWTVLIDAARRHGLDPLLHWHLSALCPGQLPELVAKRLNEHFETNRARNLLLTVELRNVLALFEDHGIPAIAYKGPTLAISAYGNLALRRFADLDLLLKSRDILKAKALLVEQGYRPRWDLTPAQETAFLKSQCELNLDRHRGRISIELHWDILPREFAFRLDEEQMWKSAERLSLDGATALTPGPEDLLLILCAHGSKHFWERLAWVADVAELVRARQDIRWPMVLAQARRAGGERMLLLGLTLASELLDADLPEEILRRTRIERVVRTLAAQAWQWQSRRATSMPGFGESLLFHLRVQDRLADRIRYTLRRTGIPTIEDWQWRWVPDRLFFLHYLLRPIRLAGKHGRKLVRRG